MTPIEKCTPNDPLLMLGLQSYASILPFHEGPTALYDFIPEPERHTKKNRKGSAKDEAGTKKRQLMHEERRRK